MTKSKVGELPSHDKLIEIILQLLASTLGKKSGELKADAILFAGQLGFDSFGLMEFVLGLEDTFGIRIPDHDLDPDIFYSVETVVIYIKSRLEKEVK